MAGEREELEGKLEGGDEAAWLVVDAAACRQPAPEAARVPPSLRAELALERPGVPLAACKLDAVLSVVAPAAGEGARAPMRLVAVLDKSGSMAGTKLTLVVRTMKFVLRHLSERDALGLVAYDTAVTVLAPLTPCDDSGRRFLEAALDRLTDGSATNLSGGLLRGLELHGEGVRPAMPQRPLQRVHFGNTYRRLSQEEAEARKREKGAERRRPPDHERVHEWTLELRLEDQADAALVRAVVFWLRKHTFPEGSVSVFEPPYKMTRLGWGTFVVRAEVHLHDGRTLELEHNLQFGPAESFHTVLLPLTPEPDPPPAVTERAAEDAEQAIVRSTFLFTDGHANHGITEAEPLCKAASAALDALGGSRCSLSTFGFGSDHSADLLQGLAEAGRGVYCYVDGEEKIAEAFGEALGGLLSTTHQNVRLCLELRPGAAYAGSRTAHPVTTRALEDGGQALEVDLGDIFAEERRDVLVTLSLEDAEAPGPQDLGRLCARGFCLSALRPEETSPLPLHLERLDGAAATGPPEPCVERQRHRQLVVEALEAARSAARRGACEEAKERLRATSDALASSALAMQGDPITRDLLRDVQECMNGLKSQAEFQDWGSKTMACRLRAHEQQRSCGLDMDATYTTTMSIRYREDFRTLQ